MNGVNLDLFQFEYDLTWMSFFMDGNDRFYARYGGRLDKNAESHLSQQSLARVMRQVIELHRTKSVQASRYEPRGLKPRVPEQLPAMNAMLASRDNKCIHCHDVKVANLKHARALNRFRRDQVFTYPTPANLGIAIDPDQQTLVIDITPESPASQSGLRPGDQVQSVNGYRILTFADFSRVLEKTPAVGELTVNYLRADKSKTSRLQLSGNWRHTADPSWRESLHVAGPNCGLWGKKLSAREKQKHGIPTGQLGLKVTFIWGAHTRRAGLRVGDIIVALDGLRRDMTIQQLHAYPMLQKDYGDTMPIVVQRGKQRRSLAIRFPDRPVE
tara:strand:- start:843 stop:1826 length:984 start_codon:yes stop_codon:yes gene_type:complete